MNMMHKMAVEFVFNSKIIFIFRDLNSGPDFSVYFAEKSKFS